MEVAKILDRMGNSHMYMKDYSEALQRWEFVLASYRAAGIDNNDPLIVEIHDNISDARFYLAKSEEF